MRSMSRLRRSRTLRLHVGAVVLAIVGALLGTSGVARAADPDHGSADVYVAPRGSDAAPGTARRPVRTLARARDLVRERTGHLTTDLTVHLAPGTYPLSEPLVLDARDSGGNGHKVVWQGAR